MDSIYFYGRLNILFGESYENDKGGNVKKERI